MYTPLLSTYNIDSTPSPRFNQTESSRETSDTRIVKKINPRLPEPLPQNEHLPLLGRLIPSRLNLHPPPQDPNLQIMSWYLLQDSSIIPRSLPHPLCRLDNRPIRQLLQYNHEALLYRFNRIHTLPHASEIPASHPSKSLDVAKVRPTHDASLDTFRLTYLLPPVAFLSLIFNYQFNFSEILWSFSIWLESVAILPQLFMLQRTGEAETITTHYLAALGLYRGLYIPNWMYRWVIPLHFTRAS